MQLKPPYRLRASDLPLIESPYFASRKVKRLLNSPSASARLDTSQIGGMADHSDHYNLLERLSFDQVIKSEFPFDGLAPFRPVSSRERTIHFNMSPE